VYTLHVLFLQVAGGLLPEALLLLQLGMSPNSHVATKAIGYKQACEFMQVKGEDCLSSTQD
jgi:tRNA A37 N6-isopentenylltransferase MiaA